jgi:non-ribosomal peptide synthetase component F
MHGQHFGEARMVVTRDMKVPEPAPIGRPSSLAFDVSTFEIWGALLNGASLYLPTGEDLLDAQKLGRHIERYGATIMFLTTGPASYEGFSKQSSRQVLTSKAIARPHV